MYLRVPILIGDLRDARAGPDRMLLLPAVIVAWGAGLWLYRKAPKCRCAQRAPGNPIALLPALGFVAFVAFAAVAAKWAQGSFGRAGIAVLLLIVGSMDVDTAIVTSADCRPTRSRRCSRRWRSPARSSPTWR